MRPCSLRPTAEQSLSGALPVSPQSSLGSHAAHGAALLAKGPRIFPHSAYTSALPHFAPLVSRNEWEMEKRKG